MNDAFCEQLVSRKPQVKDLALLILAVLVSAFLTIIGFKFIKSFTLLIAVAAVGAIWRFLVPRLITEYEYYLLNHTLEITLIQNKANRHRITEFDIRQAELVAPADSPKLAEFRPTKTLDFSSRNKDSRSYAMIVYLEHDLHKIILEPDEKMTEQMKMWLGAKMIL